MFHKLLTATCQNRFCNAVSLFSFTLLSNQKLYHNTCSVQRKMLHSILDQATNVKETIPKIECSSLRDQPKVVAERKDHITSFHGRKLSDPYYWLRERENSAVRKLIDSENQYQKEKMKPLKNLQDTIFKEIKDRILQTDESVPYVWKDYLYYTRVGIQNYC